MHGWLLGGGHWDGHGLQGEAHVGAYGLWVHWGEVVRELTEIQMFVRLYIILHKFTLINVHFIN